MDNTRLYNCLHKLIIHIMKIFHKLVTDSEILFLHTKFLHLTTSDDHHVSKLRIMTNDVTGQQVIPADKPITQQA